MPEILRKKNKGIIYSKNENDIHLICKILLQKRLLERKHNAVTEFKVENKIVDVLDDTTRTIYEIEKKPTEAYFRKIKELAEKLNADCQVIPLNKMPVEIQRDLESAIHRLKGWLEVYII